jgi:hypothetical protein
VVELVADKGGWAAPYQRDMGSALLHIAQSLVSYIATIVEVAVDDKGKLPVPRVGADRQAIGDVRGTLDRADHFYRSERSEISDRSEIDELKLNSARSVPAVECSFIVRTGGDRPIDVATSRYRNATGNDTAGAIISPQRGSASDDKPDDRRSAPRSDHQENERSREGQGRANGQVGSHPINKGRRTFVQRLFSHFDHPWRSPPITS